MVKRPPRTLYIYLLSEIALPFAGALAFFIFVLLMFQIIKLVDFFVVHKVSPYWVMYLLSSLALSLLQPAIPIAFLLAVLLGIGRLSTDGEIMAMRASGVSPNQILAPVMAAGFALFVVGSGINAYLTPWGTRNFRYELFRISNTKVMATLKEGTFMEGFFDLMLYADEVDPKGNQLKRVFIYDPRNDLSPTTTVAHQGIILPGQTSADGTPGVTLHLRNGKIYRPSSVQNMVEVIQFDNYDLFLALPTAKVVGVDRPMTMDVTELRRKIRELNNKEGKSTEDLREINRLKMEMWTRFSFAFSCVVFALLGTAFGLTRTRSRKSNSLLICLLVMLGYWQVRTVALKFGEDGYLPPFLAVELANLLLLGLAASVFRKNSA
ncbi:MAG TPA: LptF/LptG family permease [Bdellovibrionota bacterium]|jgi:lipopolysaccharide export system permease protein